MRRVDARPACDPLLCMSSVYAHANRDCTGERSRSCRTPDENQPPAARRGFEPRPRDRDRVLAPAVCGRWHLRRTSFVRTSRSDPSRGPHRGSPGEGSVVRPARPTIPGPVVRTFASTILGAGPHRCTRAHNAGVVILTVLGAGTVALVLFIRSNPAMVVGSALQGDWMFAIGVALACLGLLLGHHHRRHPSWSVGHDRSPHGSGSSDLPSSGSCRCWSARPWRWRPPIHSRPPHCRRRLRAARQRTVEDAADARQP